MEMRRTSTKGRGREFCFSFPTVLLYSGFYDPTNDHRPHRQWSYKIQSEPLGKTQARGQNSGHPGWVEAEWWRDKCTWSTKGSTPACWSQPALELRRHYSCWGWRKPCQIRGGWLGFLSWDYMPHLDIAAWFGPFWGWGVNSLKLLSDYMVYSTVTKAS